MKKNVMMRLSALLLVAVLLTTCVISGTFAKYTTNGTATDTAKVAKWGIQVNAVAPDNKEYHVTTDVLATAQDEAVLTSNAQLLAPGAGLELGYVTISGTAEVAVEVVYTATLDLGNDWVVSGNPYCPLVFKVNGTEYKIDGSTIDTVDKLEQAVVAAIEAADGGLKVAPGETVSAPALDVECYWAFGTGSTDANDTALGQAGNAGFTLTITCTVNQLDEYTPAP